MSAPRSPRPSPAPRRGRRAAWIAGVVVLLVLGGAGARLAMRAPGGGRAAPAVTATADPVVPRDVGQPVALPASVPTGVPASVATAAPGLPQAATPVALAGTARIGGVRARLAEVRAVTAHARIPGEVAGPALRLTVELTNTTDAPVSLDAVGVNLFTGTDGAPAAPVTEQSGPSFHGALAPRASAQGIYAFTVPLDRRGSVTVTVAVGPDVGTAVFAGAVG